MKPQKRTFADISAQFIDRPFREGGRGPDGYDCLGFCHAFLVAAGKAAAIVTEQGEINIDNYHHYYRQDIEAAEAAMFTVFARMGSPVALPDVLAGDLVIVRNDLGRHYPGICAGNGHIMASFVNAGVRVVSTGDKVEIVKARRL
jgi:cell wall-associated NlpC family hydrolase